MDAICVKCSIFWSVAFSIFMSSTHETCNLDAIASAQDRLISARIKPYLGNLIHSFCAGRYVLLLMAIFSIYTGLLYNEFFSIPTSIFGPSKWACPTDHTLQDRAAMEMNSTLCPSAFSTGLERTSKTPFPIGIDPTWHGTRTELTFLNSIKMKLSIILGEPSHISRSSIWHQGKLFKICRSLRERFWSHH